MLRFPRSVISRMTCAPPDLDFEGGLKSPDAYAPRQTRTRFLLKMPDSMSGIQRLTRLRVIVPCEFHTIWNAFWDCILNL
eukprot:6084339-Prorocentrum_lima.AAC.1